MYNVSIVRLILRLFLLQNRLKSIEFWSINIKYIHIMIYAHYHPPGETDKEIIVSLNTEYFIGNSLKSCLKYLFGQRFISDRSDHQNLNSHEKSQEPFEKRPQNFLSFFSAWAERFAILLGLWRLKEGNFRGENLKDDIGRYEKKNHKQQETVLKRKNVCTNTVIVNRREKQCNSIKVLKY